MTSIYYNNRTKTNYRKIYEQHYGPIPKESNGRSYEIHHIDGDDTNNNPANLKAVTIQEHYDIHYSQGDLYAALLIARKMKKSPEELSKLNRLQNQKRISDGTHHFSDGKWQSALQQKRLANGSHNFLGEKNPVYERVKNGTHTVAFTSDSARIMANDRVKNGTHPSQTKVSCCCCRIVTGLSNFVKWHGDKCKLNM